MTTPSQPMRKYPPRDLRSARNELAIALNEWRDAGGNVEEVVAAVEELFRAMQRLKAP